MADIKFNKEEKEILGRKLQMYFSEELDQDLGQFDAQFLLDFISEELGAYYYNRGLADAQSAMQERMEAISEVIYELEKPTEFVR